MLLWQARWLIWSWNGYCSTFRVKLQVLVYDILPSTTAIFNYTIGTRKLSANEQFFVGAQTVVSVLQTTQIKQGVSFIVANKIHTSTNKTTIVWIKMELFSSFFNPGWMRLMFTCLFWRYVASTVLSVPKPFGGRWPHCWTAARR